MEGRVPEAIEARSVEAIPTGEVWQYEPKWDGFRCLLARDAQAVAMYSKSGQDLSRYFPEVVAGALALRETIFTLDGEIVVPVDGQLSFDDLLQRIHPAASRVKKLAEQTPALFLAFDLVRKGKTELIVFPLSKRRLKLERFATRHFSKKSLFRLSPVSRKLKDAERWLSSAGGGSDGGNCEAYRSSISSRKPRRYAKDKTIRQCRLCHRRIPLCREISGRPQSCWLAIAWSL
jgi:ATP-dependent DNA ligase